MEGFGGDFGTLLERIQPVDPYTLKEILLKVILFLFGANVFLFVTIPVHRLWVDYRDGRYRRAYQRYTEQVIQAIFGSEDLVPPRGRIEKEALGDVCIEIKRKFKGEVGEKAKEIARRYGVIDHYVRQTDSLLAYTRITAYEKLGYLQVRFIKPKLRSEIEREKKEWMLGRLCFTYSLLIEIIDEVGFIVEKLSSLRTISFKMLEFMWFNIINTFRETGAVGDLIRFAEKNLLPQKRYSELVRALVEAFGSVRLGEATDFILRAYELYRNDNLMRLSCIRALGTIGYSDFCSIFLENSMHEDWRIRAVVCRFAYLCPYKVVIDRLIERMKDENYYVRINAGKALLFFKKKVKPILEEMLSSEDKFASDTARYLLEELKVKGA